MESHKSEVISFSKQKRIRGLILVVFLLTTGLLNAQTDFRPGYVISLNGDTISGEIDYRGDQLMATICRFKSNDGKEVEYTPEDIIGYRFTDSKYFVSKELEGKKVFLEFLIKGQMNIYYYRDEKGDHYFVEKADIELTELPYEEGIKLDEDGIGTKYKTTKHLLLLTYLMQDAPMLRPKIENLGKPEHNQLIKLAEDYHNIVCKDNKCVIYVKKQTPVRVELVVVGGIINFFNLNNNYQDKNYFQGGILAHLWLPRTSEKIYFKTGILMFNLESSFGSELHTKVPIQIEYKYPKGLIRPVLAFGYNIYTPDPVLNMALTGGVDIRLYKSASLALAYDIDFNPKPQFALAPDDVLSQFVSAGLLYRF